MITTAPCALCGCTSYRKVADLGWRCILRCSDCTLVRADPLPDAAEKLRAETEDYESDDACPEVQELFANYHRDYVEDPIILRMKQHLGELERATGGPGTLLDVGSATGILLHLARERGWQPTGIELCAERAAQSIKEFDLPVRTGTIEEVVFDAGSFDAITMFDVVEHTTTPLAMLRRTHALLRPGGAVSIAVPNQDCLLTVLMNVYGRLHGPAAPKLLSRLYVPLHLHYFTPRTLSRLAHAAGFQVRKVTQAPVHLGRYKIPFWMNIPLRSVLRAGAAVGMDGRVEVLAIKPSS